MLSSTSLLDDLTIESIMSSKPFSRLPVYQGDNRKDIIGCVGPDGRWRETVRAGLAMIWEITQQAAQNWMFQGICF